MNCIWQRQSNSLESGVLRAYGRPCLPTNEDVIRKESEEEWNVSLEVSSVEVAPR